MAIQLPRTLKNFNVYIDGEGYAGRCDTGTLPTLALTMDDHRAGGMDAPIKLDMGMEAMTSTVVMSDYSEKIIPLLGVASTALTFRAAVQAQGGGVAPVVVNMRGMLSTVDFGEWQPGTKSTKTLSFELTYFRYRHGDIELCEIDMINMIRKIGGVDMLAQIRAAIGL